MQQPYLAIEQPPSDEHEAGQFARLKQLITDTGELPDLRTLAPTARALLGAGYEVHCGSSHIWIKRLDSAQRLAIIADRPTTSYRDWDTPALVTLDPSKSVPAR